MHHRTDQAVHRGDTTRQGRAVGQLTHAILDDDTGIESDLAITGSASQGIRDQTSAFHTFYLIDQTKDRRRHMDTIRNDLDGHIIEQIDTFHRSLILILAAFMEARHGVIEMGGVGITYLISGQDILKLGLGMPYRGEYAFRGDIFTELHRSRKFRSGVPALDAMRFLQQRDIFLGIGILDILRDLSTSHFHIEIMSF